MATLCVASGGISILVISGLPSSGGPGLVRAQPGTG